MMLYVDNPVWNSVFAGPSTWPRDATLVRQGEIPTTVYVVDEGAVQLVHITPDGDEYVLDLKPAPALVGGAFVIAERASNVEVRTLTTCVLRWCSAQLFVAAVIGDDGHASETHRLNCTEIVDLLDRAAAMSIKSASARLEHFLARDGDIVQGGLGRFGFRQSVFASLLNVTPEHLSRLLKKRMAKLGFLPRRNIRNGLDRERRRT